MNNIFLYNFTHSELFAAVVTNLNLGFCGLATFPFSFEFYSRLVDLGGGGGDAGKGCSLRPGSTRS